MLKRESGQVLPLGLVLIVLGMMGALVLYNTGQVATDKMRLANAADAAAYSGALFQARALNYTAYSNRAMVANQVAIGQAVSIRSWIRYAEGVADNIQVITSWIPFVNGITSTVQSAVSTADSLLGSAIDIYLRVIGGITVALSASQTAMQLAAVASTEELIRVIPKQTDNRFETDSAWYWAQVGYRAGQWIDFTDQYSNTDKNQMLERTSLVMESRDGFTRARNWEFGTRFANIKRQGETQLFAFENSQGLIWEWVAKDTMSTHVGLGGWFGISSVEAPMAWASAFANNSSNTSVSTRRRACRGFGSYRPTQSCDDFTDDNEDAEYLADNNVRSLRGTETRQPMRGYLGLQKFYDLGSHARDSDDARLHVNVEVSMALEAVDESNEIFHGTEQHNAVVAAGTTLSAISSADVLYRRPDHYALEESEREKANAYNPYWQAQLVPGNADRAPVAPIRAGGLTPTAYGAPLDSHGGSSSDSGYYDTQ